MNVVDHVMRTFAMMANLTDEEARSARSRLERHLAACEGTERQLAIEGLRFLRQPRPVRHRRNNLQRDDVRSGAD
ncbi:hypothetical protein [Bradyrhizobium cosmicum]|uniref:hypothetical protein n=1 Tax=Bradyrhizobium cosmicum TaxID=1404864 RepID=UPI0028E36711|nr:hypothetical protein [Bradyrhizobium cosmicum]